MNGSCDRRVCLVNKYIVRVRAWRLGEECVCWARADEAMIGMFSQDLMYICTVELCPVCCA